MTSNADSGAGSLRQAIADACADGTITFDASLAGQTITLTSAQLTIDKNLTIDGGADNITVSGGNTVRVFSVNSGVTCNLKNITVTNGTAGSDYGGGISNKGALTVNSSRLLGNSAKFGGGMYNEGTLTVTDSSFTGNTISQWGGGGGCIHNNGTLTVTNSTFSGNISPYGAGGCIYNNQTLTVTGSTFSGNSVQYSGGGILNTGTLTMTNSTFSGNGSQYGSGGGICNLGGTLNFTNTLIANSSSGGDCQNDGFMGGGIGENTHNLVEDGSCSDNGVNFLTGDPLLAALGDYGGPTQTMPLLPGSPAIDAGDNTTCAATDQRGKSRAGACDIGAFESQGFTLSVSGGDNQSAVISASFTTALGVTVTADIASEPVNGGKVTVTPPGSGASAAITTSPATISGGAASVTATANATAGGPYAVTASAAGAASVDFSLTNVETTTTTTSIEPTTTTTSVEPTTTTSVQPTTSSTTTSIVQTTTTTTSVVPTTTTTSIEPTTTTTSVVPTTTTTSIEPTTTTTVPGCEQLTAYYQDADGDTYGNPAVSTLACEAPAGYVDNSSGFDCDDTDAEVHPGAAEVCNGIDDDCNGLVDDNDTCIITICSVRIFPRRISKLFASITPNMIPFAIIASKGSAVEFQRPISIDWGTQFIDDWGRVRIGKRGIFGFLYVSPIRLETGDFEVTVRFGPGDTVCAGKITVW